ncbi:hypothetical protein BH20ACI3_BH20ACI3_25590 [soil metagenome]
MACVILDQSFDERRGMMNQRDRIREILAAYQKHGWRLRRLLLVPETRAEVVNKDEVIFEGARVEEANVDALWFSRSSDGKREAWELRLIAETAYALFETFQADEPEQAREDTRREMQARMSQFITRKHS